MMKELKTTDFYAANRLSTDANAVISLLELCMSDEYTHSEKRAFARTARAILRNTIHELVADEKDKVATIPF